MTVRVCIAFPTRRNFLLSRVCIFPPMDGFRGKAGSENDLDGKKQGKNYHPCNPISSVSLGEHIYPFIKFSAGSFCGRPKICTLDEAGESGRKSQHLRGENLPSRTLWIQPSRINKFAAVYNKNNTRQFFKRQKSDEILNKILRIVLINIASYIWKTFFRLAESSPGKFPNEIVSRRATTLRGNFRVRFYLFLLRGRIKAL